MDGENNGKPLLKWMIWGIPPFKETPIWPEKSREMHSNMPLKI